LVYPYSEDLEEIIFGLKHSTIIKVQNPEYRKYEIDQKIKENLRDIAKNNFGIFNLSKIKEMSKIFEEKTKL